MNAAAASTVRARLLVARGLEKTLRAPRGIRRRHPHAFRLGPVSFELERGAAVAVLGPNGAGKTTLLRTLAGIYRRDGGTLEVAGRCSPIIGVWPPFPLDLTVAEHLRSWKTLLGGPAAAAALELAGLREQADQPVRWLSSGQRVRLGITPGLMVPADLYLIDEALAVCDPEFRARAVELLRLRCSEGAALLLAGQDLLTARALCDRGLLLESGRLVMDSDLDRAIAALTVSGGRDGGDAVAEARHRGDREIIEAVDVDSPEGRGPIRIRIRARNITRPFQLLVAVKGGAGRVLHSSRTGFDEAGWDPRGGEVEAFEVLVPAASLSPGRYRIAVSVVGPDQVPLVTREDAAVFSIGPSRS